MKKQKPKIRKNIKIIPQNQLHRYVRSSFRKLKPVLVQIQFLKEGDLIREAMIEHSIRKTVTIFEVTFKSVSYHCGKNRGYELDKIFTETITDYTPSSPTLMKLYYELLGIDFLDEAKKYYDNFNNEGVEHDECHIRNIPRLSKNLGNFVKIFEYRNKLVHEDSLPIIQYKELRKMIGSVFDVMISTWILY